MKTALRPSIRQAIQKIDPRVKAYIIHEDNRHSLTEWTVDGKKKSVGGGLETLYEMAKKLAEADGGMVICYGGGKESLNFSGIDPDRPDVKALAEILDHEREARLNLKGLT